MVAASTARLTVVPGGNGISDESGAQIITEDAAPVMTEDVQSTVSRSPLIETNVVPLRIFPSGNGIFSEDGGAVLDESGDPIRPEQTPKATIFSTNSTDADVSVSTVSLTVTPRVASVALGPYLESVSFSEGDDSWSINSGDGTGSIVWAIVATGGAAPAPNGSGGWSGTVVNSGSVSFGLTLDIDTGGTPGTSYDFYAYQRTAGGVDSNVIVQNYTPNVEVNTAGLVITTFRASLVPNNIDAFTEQLVLTPRQAAVRLDVVVSAGFADLTITPSAATISTGINIFADAANLSITPRQATVSVVGSIRPSTAALTLTPYAATVSGVANQNAVTAEDSKLGGRLASSDLQGSLGRHKLTGKVSYG